MGHHSGGIGLVVIITQYQPQPVSIAATGLMPLAGNRWLFTLGVQAIGRQRVHSGTGVVGAAMTGAIVPDSAYIGGGTDSSLALIRSRSIQSDTTGHAPVGL